MSLNLSNTASTQWADVLPSDWIKGNSNRLSYALWFTSRGDEGLPVVLVSIHADNLCEA